MSRLLLATGGRFGRIDDPESNGAVAWSLERSRAASLAVETHDPDTVYVGRHANGLARTGDGGRTWQEAGELPERDVFSVARSRGKAPARSGGDVLQGGQLLGPHAAERLLVGIELGGLMLSEDGGQSFSDHRPGAQPDVDALAWHPWTSHVRWIAPQSARRRRGCETTGSVRFLRRPLRRRPRPRARRDAPTRQAAAERRGAATAGVPGRRPTRAASTAMCGRSRSIPRSPSAGMSRPPKARARRTAAGGRELPSTGGRETAPGGASPSCSSRCPTRSRALGGRGLRGPRRRNAVRSGDRGESWEPLPARADGLLALAAVEG